MDKQQDYSDYESFYEELAFESGSYPSYHEELRYENRYSDTGLSEDDVYKLTEDINNPLPPADPSE